MTKAEYLIIYTLQSK